MEKRIKLINNIINGIGDDLDEYIRELTQYEWDYKWTTIILKRNHVKNAFVKYLNFQITYNSMSEWADFLELRDEVDYESEEIKGIINLLANPEINGEISWEEMRSFLK